MYKEIGRRVTKIIASVQQVGILEIDPSVHGQYVYYYILY